MSGPREAGSEGRNPRPRHEGEAAARPDACDLEEGPARARVRAILRGCSSPGTRLGVYLRQPFGPLLIAEVDGGLEAPGRAAAKAAMERGEEVIVNCPAPATQNRSGPRAIETLAAPIERAGHALGALVVSARRLGSEEREMARLLARMIGIVLGAVATPVREPAETVRKTDTEEDARP